MLTYTCTHTQKKLIINILHNYSTMVVTILWVGFVICIGKVQTKPRNCENESETRN